MKSTRKGLGKGRGTGYKNIIRSDPVVHRNSGLGKKTYSKPVERKMSMTAPKFTPVIFRKWKAGQFKGDIDAIFPDQVADLDGNVSTYTHFGQHGSGDFNFMLSKTVPAKPSEYAELEKELESIGYRDLKSYMKDTPQFQEARRKQLKKDSDGDGVPDKFDCKPFDQKKQDSNWTVERENNNNKVWLSEKYPSVRMNLRWNYMLSKWQLFMTDGIVEIKDFGKFKDSEKEDALRIAETEMKKFKIGKLKQLDQKLFGKPSPTFRDIRRAYNFPERPTDED